MLKAIVFYVEGLFFTLITGVAAAHITTGNILWAGVTAMVAAFLLFDLITSIGVQLANRVADSEKEGEK